MTVMSDEATFVSTGTGMRFHTHTSTGTGMRSHAYPSQAYRAELI